MARRRKEEKKFTGFNFSVPQEIQVTSEFDFEELKDYKYEIRGCFYRGGKKIICVRLKEKYLNYDCD